MKKNQYVTPKGDLWQVKGENNQKATKLFDTQSEAICYGREIAKNQSSELFILRPNGQIRDRDSYGNDNFPPKDTKF